MKYVIDIDGTICKEVGEVIGREPYMDRIEKINKLYDEGNIIIYWTARGTVTGLDWNDLTKTQLDSWGAKYHEVNLGKPAYDFFICDKAINSEVFFKEENV